MTSVRDAHPNELPSFAALRRRIWAALDPDREPPRDAAGYYLPVRDAVELGAWTADGQLAGCARLTVHTSPHDLPHAQTWAHLGAVFPAGRIALLSRLVVDSPFRGLGVANALDDARIERARSLGATSVLGFSHALEGGHRRSTLVRRGFQPIGEAQPDPLTTSLLLLPVLLVL